MNQDRRGVRTCSVSQVKSLCNDFSTKKMERTGTKQKDSKHLVNHGERIFQLKMEDGIIRGARMQVTSVTDMNDARQDVYFPRMRPNLCNAVHRETGSRSSSEQRRGVFEIRRRFPKAPCKE